MKKALFIGDVNADLIMAGIERLPEPDREIACREMRLTIGSPVAIAACAYASLGGDAALSGLAGEDQYGDFVLEGLAEFGVDTSPVERTRDVDTGLTLCLIVDGQRAQVTYPGAIALFDGKQLTEERLRGYAHLHFAGVYLQKSFLPHLTEVLDRAKRLGITTSLDPQWDDTERWDGMGAWLPLVSWFFANEVEACSITGTDSAEAACRALSDRTPCPIVKLGARGALIWDGESVQLIPPFRAEIVDTTGAGDSFAAGTLFARKELGYSLPDAVRFGNAVGARCCGFLGGVAARSTCDDILAYIKENA